MTESTVDGPEVSDSDAPGDGTLDNPKRVYVGIPDEPGDMALRCHALRAATDRTLRFSTEDKGDAVRDVLADAQRFYEWLTGQPG